MSPRDLVVGYPSGFVGMLSATPTSAFVDASIRCGLKFYHESPIYRGQTVSQS